MKMFLKFLNFYTVRKRSDAPSGAAYLCKWWLGSTWSLNDLVLSRKTGEQQGFSRMCTRMNYVREILKDIILKDDSCESSDGKLATHCCNWKQRKCSGKILRCSLS